MKPQFLLTLSVLALTAFTSIRAASIDGQWTAEFGTQIGPQKYVYEFKSDGEKITGHAAWERRGEKGVTEFVEGKIVDDLVSFVEPTKAFGLNIRITYQGKLAGDEIRFTRQIGKFATEQFVAKRVARAAAPIRVLIVDGFSNHDWQLTTALIRGIIEPTGLFTVSVSTAPPKADSPGWDTWRPKFSDYDVVIQNCNDIKGGPQWPQAVQADFEAFVTQGGGVYIWHSANNAFTDWPAYNEMIGLGWRKKEFGPAIAVDEQEQLVRIPTGEGRDTGHGARVDTVVKRRGDHPIHAGMPRQWLTPDIEVYYYGRGPAKNIEVLSYGFDPKTKMNWPLEWTVAYGQGRVYTSTFGHVWAGDTQPARMRCAGVQTVVVRALQWLAKRDVTWPVPSDFPTADKISVRAEAPPVVPANPTP